MFLKTLGLHVFLTATKKTYLGNSKHIEANAQALTALRSSLIKDYISMVSHSVRLCSVEHVDFSRAPKDESCGDGI